MGSGGIRGIKLAETYASTAKLTTVISVYNKNT
jgi:hypothetical protein